MPWPPFSRHRNAWETGALPVAWSPERPSIYGFVRSHIQGGQPGLTADGEDLPDEALIRDEGALRWIAGGQDGAFGHHGGGGREGPNADAVFQALSAVLSKATEKTLGALYELLAQDDLIGYVDPLLDRIRETGRSGKSLPVDRLYRLARWLAENAPDRGPVKFAVALLGLVDVDDRDDVELLLTLGRHEEFTLYVAVALQSKTEDPERDFFELAKHVKGWGRIHVVEGLAPTQNPEIKAWLLREGFRNDVMYEYLAYIAATTGDLVEELRRPEPDDALLLGAGEILQALVCGGPAEDMDDYAEGAEATELYLQHMEGRARELKDFLVVDLLRRFVTDEEAEWKERETRGWTADRRAKISALADAIVRQPEWREKALDGISAEDDVGFWEARRVAEALGIDTWEYSFRRQESGTGDAWFDLMQTEDPGRIDRVIRLAKEQIPLHEVATGPGEEWGLGEEFRHHSALDWIVQGLGRFPGKGWELIKVTLESPVVRNRIMALRALSAWGQDRWPEEARDFLDGAEAREPDDEVKDRIRRLIAGEDIDLE